ARVVEPLLDVDDEEGGVGGGGGAHGLRVPEGRSRAKTPILPIGDGDGEGNGMKGAVKTELELRHLRAFVTVVEAVRHTRAAPSPRASKSTVSEPLIALERALGTELFRKGARGVVLPRSGEALLPYARRLLSLSSELVAQLAGVAKGVKATLAVSAVESVSTYVLPPRLAALREEWPKVSVEV